MEKHGEGEPKSAEYSAWDGMKRRCYNPKCISYKNYGAKGITVCERWRNSYINFLQDMGRKPSRGHSLDRIDSKKNYTPDNCKWSTRVEQNNNTSRNRFVTWNGVTKSIYQWSREVNINPVTLTTRLDWNWDVESALTKPVLQRPIKLKKEQA